MNKVFKYILFILLISLSFAGTDGTIRGRIVSATDAQPLPGVQVFIPDEGLGTVSDLDGNFLLLNVPIGSHEVNVVMIGYKTIKAELTVSMDKTTWYNVSLEAAALQGETIYVSGEKKLVEKGRTSKKVTVGKEAIEALPIKDISELYSLQAGVVKIESGMQGAVPGNEERGLEEVHVRGGRSGEIAYMIDGLYIRNPIYGGIGSGTRLNLFAVREFDWQPGGFNAEYGDAMSAVSNMHTMTGGKEYQFKYKYETSLVGAASGNLYDELRDYNDHNIGFGGPVPFIKDLTFWVSSQLTNIGSSRVFEFDDRTYIQNDPGNDINRELLIAPWDTYSGMHGFGFAKTNDVFSKIAYKIGPVKLNLSHWIVENHRQAFSPSYIYWNDGQNELFRDTERTTFEINHNVNPKTFYTLRMSSFSQASFQGVRWQDSDSDGYPDWYEWSHAAGSRPNSDPYNPNVVPYTGDETVEFMNRDGDGPNAFTSGWYVGAQPGNYNWNVAEKWIDSNGNKVYDLGETFFDANNNYEWDGPELVQEAIYRDGSYWLTPEMYVDYQDFKDEYYYYQTYSQDAYNAYHDPDSDLQDIREQIGFDDEEGRLFAIYDSLYFIDPSGTYKWDEGFIFGGSDRYYGTSNAVTKEIRFDLTSQLTNEWRARVGFDLKSHKLEFSEIVEPWRDDKAFRQRFSEQWDDVGTDGILYTECDTCTVATDGEGDGFWQAGEPFDDFNGNGKWDNYVEPIELAGYWQNTYEVPWMVINAGLRLDAVNYNTKIWADPLGNYSSTEPWYFLDWGIDQVRSVDINQDGDYDDEGDIAPDFGEGDGQYNSGGDGIWTDVVDGCPLCGNESFIDRNGNGQYDFGESFVDEGEAAGNYTQSGGNSEAVVIFKASEWFYDLSPRIGFSHVITDRSTFTFNYGVYHQNPKYERIYLNTNRLEDPQDVFEDDGAGWIGNGTMGASRTKSYEAAFNVQAGPRWAYTVGLWVKDMDGLVTAKTHRTGIYEYQVADNGDFGRASGIDFTFENKGAINTTLQYTYSEAKANGAYDAEAVGQDTDLAPTYEYTMSFDRTHDIAASFYTRLPFGINAGLTYFYMTGFPFTPYKLPQGATDPSPDLANPYSERAQDYQKIDLSFSKFLKFKKTKVALGLNVYNLFDHKNVIQVYPLTGSPDNPGSHYFSGGELDTPSNQGEHSSGYYDRPWYYSTPREINFFVRFDFN